MQKITRKSIFSNLLKLVFITLFVGVFSQIFGTNNSLTWVCVLIGTMMYWYMDIGINIKQAPFVIVLMFLQIGFSNKLAQITSNRFDCKLYYNILNYVHSISKTRI